MKALYLVFNLIRKKLCLHNWTYIGAKTLIGRRWAEYRCIKCGKIGHMRYDYEYEIGKRDG